MPLVVCFKAVHAAEEHEAMIASEALLGEKDSPFSLEDFHFCSRKIATDDVGHSVTIIVNFKSSSMQSHQVSQLLHMSGA